MDCRGWLWKKKSSDKNLKAENVNPVSTSESVGSILSSVAHVGDQQDNCKNKNYVQISMESYTRMSGLEDQFLNLEDQVKALEAKLSAVYSELNNKDNLVKQHAKVAEEEILEELEAENKYLKEKMDELKNDLTEEKRSHHDALVNYKEIEEKMQRDKCMVCASNSVAIFGKHQGPLRPAMEVGDALLRVDFVREVDELLQEVRYEHSEVQNESGFEPESVANRLKQQQKKQTIHQVEALLDLAISLKW